MVRFNLSLFNIQHIKKLHFCIDLSNNNLMCIAGKNGSGKTTLIRAIKTLKSAETFSTTASPYIFEEHSLIHYDIDNETYEFTYNPSLEMIDTKSIINPDIKDNIFVELPIPHGDRFNHFKKLGEIDDELRRCITLEEYDTPDELIFFLTKVYNSNRFDNLKEISIKGSKYYFILKIDDFYIREDYLSSGEYFVINLYKLIQRKCTLIAIDEIDISLDASAQVNLIEQLRDFCKAYNVNIIFTTHSLALMKTMTDQELYYMENIDGEATLTNTSYNYIKSILFGFKGWDKYILTEDKTLERYLTHLIRSDNELVFYKYKIIYIGGGRNVIDLMTRNNNQCFLSSPENVISVLDGDQKPYGYCNDNEMIFFIPFESVEKHLKELYDNGEPIPRVNNSHDAKRLYKSLIKTQTMSEIDIFKLINDRKSTEVAAFKSQIINFLGTA